MLVMKVWFQTVLMTTAAQNLGSLTNFATVKVKNGVVTYPVMKTNSETAVISLVN